MYVRVVDLGQHVRTDERLRQTLMDQPAVAQRNDAVGVAPSTGIKRVEWWRRTGRVNHETAWRRHACLDPPSRAS